jgi:hypothetical protein
MLRLLSALAILCGGAALAEDAPPTPAAEPSVATAPAPEVWKTIELEWEKIDKADTYEVRLTPATGGQVHVFTTPENHLSQNVPVGNYKLQIRARDNETGDMSAWSAASDLEVAVKEIIPLHPADQAIINAETTAKQSIEFKWTPVDKVRIYTLKVWSEEKKDNPWTFTGRATSRRLEVPPGRVYYWQVSFESANDVSYHQEPKIFSFTLEGTQLLQPEIHPYQAGKDLSWKGGAETKFYKTKLYYRHLDEKEWKLIGENSVNEAQLPFAKMKPGNYKIEVIAAAPRRLNSPPANYEFLVKPPYAELMKNLKLPQTEQLPVKRRDPVTKRTSRIVPRVEHVASAKILN